MLGVRFERLFGDLVGRWTEWREAPRNPELVPELARARFALEDARSAIASERQKLTAPVHDDPSRTSVSAEDRARLRVFGTGYQQN